MQLEHNTSVLMQELSEANMRVMSAQQELDAQRDTTSTEDDVRALQHKLEDMQAEHSAVQESLREELENERAVLQDTLEEKRRERQKLQSKLEEAQDEYARLETRFSDLQFSLGEQISKEQEYRHELADLREDLDMKHSELQV